MSRGKINSVCISNYNADLNRIEELEADIRFMQRRIQKMKLQVRQKVAKRVEYEAQIRGFDEDQRFEEAFWKELNNQKTGNVQCEDSLTERSR
ncbi:hypothetical protein Q1695_012266 [Nippostrongylus brasiliensis]|nr:hypothetical protein Q1695_012266 [Nippostrongylus brasiliensis]